MGHSRNLDARLLKPYVSSVVFVQRGQACDVVVRAVKDYIAADERSEIVAEGLSNMPKEVPPSTSIGLALAYASLREPPWGGLPQAEPELDSSDRVNHLVLIVERKELIAVHSTDDRIKTHLLRRQAKLQLGGVGLLTRPALEESLLSGEIATFWMGDGAASRGRRGPRSKTTYGERLEDTIDVIGDQRHTLSGARGAVGEEVLGAGLEGVIGVNLEKSGFWLRRTDNLSQFLNVLDRILSRISAVVASGGGQERFVIFARYVDDLDAVEGPYDVGFAVPGEQPGVLPSSDEIDAYEWLQNRLVSVSSSGRRTARLVLADDAGGLGTFSVRPNRLSGGAVEFDVAQVDGDSMFGQTARQQFNLVNPRIYYESGHTVTERGVISEHFTDVPFGGWVFQPIEAVIAKEKPGKGTRNDISTKGGREGDDSLFGWVIRSTSTGWLYCDDGSDELCDFVQLDTDANELIIWHVKACKAGRGRGIAAVPYEDVCSQVAKNAPTLSLSRLVTELEQRLQKADHGPVWKDGALTGDLGKMIEALQEPRANLKIIVRVLQPHVTEDLLLRGRVQEGEGLHGEHQRLRRLDHLLIATDDAVSRLGAHLEVVTTFTTDDGIDDSTNGA